MEGSIELIDQGLHHRLEQLASRLEDQFPKLALEGQELLLGRVLIEELLDVSGGFFLEGFLDFVAFFFEPGAESARVMATVVSTNWAASFSNSLRPSMACARAWASSADRRRVLFWPSSQT